MQQSLHGPGLHKHPVVAPVLPAHKPFRHRHEPLAGQFQITLRHGVVGYDAQRGNAQGLGNNGAGSILRLFVQGKAEQGGIKGVVRKGQTYGICKNKPGRTVAGTCTIPRRLSRRCPSRRARIRSRTRPRVRLSAHALIWSRACLQHGKGKVGPHAGNAVPLQKNGLPRRTAAHIHHPRRSVPAADTGHTVAHPVQKRIQQRVIIRGKPGIFIRMRRHARLRYLPGARASPYRSRINASSLFMPSFMFSRELA